MPRKGVTRARVIEEAALLADDVGLEALTLAAVAKRLGITVPALYKHIDGIAQLRRDLAVLGVEELTEQMRAAAAGRAGGDALWAIAGAYRDYAREHPALEAASVRAPAPGDAEHMAAGEAAVGVMADCLAGYALADDDLVHAVRAVRVVLHGMVSLEAAGGFGLAQPVDLTFERLIAALHADLAARSPSRAIRADDA